MGVGGRRDRRQSSGEPRPGILDLGVSGRQHPTPYSSLALTNSQNTSRRGHSTPPNLASLGGREGHPSQLLQVCSHLLGEEDLSARPQAWGCLEVLERKGPSSWGKTLIHTQEHVCTQSVSWTHETTRSQAAQGCTDLLPSPHPAGNLCLSVLSVICGRRSLPRGRASSDMGHGG